MWHTHPITNLRDDLADLVSDLTCLAADHRDSDLAEQCLATLEDLLETARRLLGPDDEPRHP